MLSSEVTDSVDKKYFPDTVNDPRSKDIPEDNSFWIKLFKLVRELGETKDNAHLYGHLLFLRLMGTRLKASEQWGFVLEPQIGNDVWSSREQYERMKKVLDLHRKELVELLGRLAEKK